MRQPHSRVRGCRGSSRSSSGRGQQEAREVFRGGRRVPVLRPGALFVAAVQPPVVHCEALLTTYRACNGYAAARSGHRLPLHYTPGLARPPGVGRTPTTRVGVQREMLEEPIDKQSTLTEPVDGKRRTLFLGHTRTTPPGIPGSAIPSKSGCSLTRRSKASIGTCPSTGCVKLFANPAFS